MIDAKNLLVNTTPPINSSKDIQENSSADPSLLSSGTEEKKDDSKDANTMDPNSFVIMLSQVLANAPTAETPAANEANPQEVQNALISQLTNTATQSQDTKTTNVAANATDTPKPLLNTAPQDLKAQLLVEENSAKAAGDNPAVSWIESQAFQSLNDSGQFQPANLTAQAPVKQEAPVDLTQNIPAAVVQAPPAPASTTATLTNIHAKATDGANQTIQQLSAAILGVDNATAEKMGADLLDTSISMNITQVPANQTAATTTNTAAPKSLDIPVPLAHPQWGDKFSEHIVWLGQNDIKSAIIKIHPEELGPLEISVKVSKDASASVNIISHSAHVKDLVDQAIPKLRDMMAEQGLNLSDVQVSTEQRSTSSHGRSDNNDHQAQGGGFIDAPEEETQLVTTLKRPPKRLVDYFA